MTHDKVPHPSNYIIKFAGSVSSSPEGAELSIPIKNQNQDQPQLQDTQQVPVGSNIQPQGSGRAGDAVIALIISKYEGLKVRERTWQCLGSPVAAEWWAQ